MPPLNGPSFRIEGGGEALPTNDRPRVLNQQKSSREQKRGSDYRLEDQIGFLLRCAHQRATEIFQGTIGELKLTPPQAAILVTLLQKKELNHTELARIVAMDMATLLGVLNRLRQRRLLNVKKNNQDGRSKLIRLSPKGELLARKFVRVGPVISEKTLAVLSKNDRGEVLRLLRQLAGC